MEKSFACIAENMKESFYFDRVPTQVRYEHAIVFKANFEVI